MGGNSVGREDPAVPSLGEADFLLRLGEMGPLSCLPFCFISSYSKSMGAPLLSDSATPS